MAEMLHARLRVSDLDATIKWFEDLLDFKVVNKNISPDGNQLAFMTTEGENTKLELAYSEDFGSIELQEDLMHLAFAIEDWDQLVKRLEAMGEEFSWGPIEGSDGHRMAFVDHPDGYEIELIERLG